MRKNNIGNRNQLAARLTAARATVYESFDEDWSGYATDSMIAQLITHLGVDFGGFIKPANSVHKSRQQ